MPILHCYVDERTLQILQAVSERDGMQRTPAQLAEDAIADAAIRALPPHLRTQDQPESPRRG